MLCTPALEGLGSCRSETPPIREKGEVEKEITGTIRKGIFQCSTVAIILLHMSGWSGKVKGTATVGVVSFVLVGSSSTSNLLSG